MSANTLSQVTFRVQAIGGKFLADDIGGARIIVRDAESGELLADRVTQEIPATWCRRRSPPPRWRTPRRT